MFVVMTIMIVVMSLVIIDRCFYIFKIENF